MIRLDMRPSISKRHGSIPLPHYMERDPDATDSERYQTVFARAPEPVAAPTAGLHFTPENPRKKCLMRS